MPPGHDGLARTENPMANQEDGRTEGAKRHIEPVRSIDQNKTQWPILQAFSEQLQWPVNGHMVYMDPADWKDVLTAAFRRETVRLAQGLDGGIVMLGMRTSKMTKAVFSEWLEFLYATAALRGVVVHDDEKGGLYEQRTTG
jgi:hypothetical protein